LISDSGVTAFSANALPITGTINLQLDGNTAVFKSYPLASPSLNEVQQTIYPILNWMGSVGPGTHDLSIEVSVDPLAQCVGTETAQIDGTLQVLVFN
jgi:hypothetical protein